MLQTVEVKGDQAEVELGAGAACELAVEVPLEGTPVRVTRECVREGRRLELVGRRFRGDEHDPIDEATQALTVGCDGDEVAQQQELLDHDCRRRHARTPADGSGLECFPTLGDGGGRSWRRRRDRARSRGERPSDAGDGISSGRTLQADE